MTDKTWLKPLYDSWSQRTRDPATDDEWDRGDTSTSHSIRGIQIGTERECDLWVAGTAKPGDTVWLIYAVWSTGDSFGHDHGERIEFISTHRQEDVAEYNAALCLAAKDFVPVTLILDDGTPMPYGVPWNGYFDSLDQLYVDSFVIQSLDR